MLSVVIPSYNGEKMIRKAEEIIRKIFRRGKNEKDKRTV